MLATSNTDEKARVGDAFPRLELTASSGSPVAIPDPAGDFVHLQLRPAELAKYEVELPFPLIADPERQLYQRFGVESRPGSLLSGRALRAAIAGQTAALAKRSTMRAFGPIKPSGGPFGLPADFLIAPDGRLAALKYGQHAYDQWTVDELLEHAKLVPAEARFLTP